MPPSPTAHWKLATLLGLAGLFSFIYFYEGGGWNQNSRFDLLRAIVELHTLQIDAYHENTQDKAHFHGHYYSEKAPGLVFLAVPFAEVARVVVRAVGVDPESPPGEYALSYIVTACTVALPTALAGVCLFFLALRFGSNVTGAAFATMVFAVGTPMLAYASLFWAHALVGACLLFAFAADGGWPMASRIPGGLSPWGSLLDGRLSRSIPQPRHRPCSPFSHCHRYGRAAPPRACASSSVLALARRRARLFCLLICTQLRRLPSQLFLLRSEFVFLHAAAGLFRPDLPASRPPP